MKTKILMVCLGNICRSPLAEGILKSKVSPDFCTVDSAGTAGYHIGSPPDKRSIAVAKKNGIDISQQLCRLFTKSDFETFDVIYAMDKSNYANIITQAKNKVESAKVRLLLNEVELGISQVPDPYHGGEIEFENVYNLIDKACSKIAEQMTQSNE